MKHLLPVNPSRLLVTMVAFIAASVAFVSTANAETPPDGEFRSVTSDANGKPVGDGIVVEVGRNVQPSQVIRAYGAQFKAMTGQDLTWQVIQAKNPSNTFPVCWTRPGHPTYGRRGDTSVWEGCPEAKRGLAFMAGVWGRVVIPAKPVETYAERMERLVTLDACVKDKKCLEQKLEALAKGAPAQASPPAPIAKPAPAPSLSVTPRVSASGSPTVAAPVASPATPNAGEKPAPAPVTGSDTLVWFLTLGILACFVFLFLGYMLGDWGKAKALKKMSKEFTERNDRREADFEILTQRRLKTEADRVAELVKGFVIPLVERLDKAEKANAKLRNARTNEATRIAQMVTDFVIPVVERLEEVERHRNSLLGGSDTIAELDKQLRETEAKVVGLVGGYTVRIRGLMNELESAKVTATAASRATIPDGAIMHASAIAALEQEHKKALERKEAQRAQAVSEAWEQAFGIALPVYDWKERMTNDVMPALFRNRKGLKRRIQATAEARAKFASEWDEYALAKSLLAEASRNPGVYADELPHFRQRVTHLFASLKTQIEQLTGLDFAVFLNSAPDSRRLDNEPLQVLWLLDPF